MRDVSRETGPQVSHIKEDSFKRLLLRESSVSQQEGASLVVPAGKLCEGAAVSRDPTTQQRLLGGMKTFEIRFAEPELLPRCSKLKVNAKPCLMGQSLIPSPLSLLPFSLSLYADLSYFTEKKG